MCGIRLEHFDPFFDHRLVEFMFRVPGDLKIRDGVTKRLLRDAMRGILPRKHALASEDGVECAGARLVLGRGLERLAISSPRGVS